MAESRFAPSQWETTLLCNGVFHWLGTNLESATDVTDVKLQPIADVVCFTDI